VGHWSCGNWFEPFHFGFGGAVDEEAEDVVDHDGIVDLAGFFVGLAHEDDSRAGLVLKRPSMPAMAAGWFCATYLPCEVAGGKDDEDRGDDAGDDADFQEDACRSPRAAFEQIERADSGHDEGAGDHCAAHIVHVLQPGPGVQQQLPEADDFKVAVGQRV
jgi:hypothetical protein